MLGFILGTLGGICFILFVGFGLWKIIECILESQREQHKQILDNLYRKQLKLYEKKEHE